MKKIWLIVTFLLLGGISASVFPQQKYWIYFTDKGITPSTNLAKKARAALSERAIQRRMLRSETGKIFDDSDLHVFVPYIEGVAKIGAQIQQKSKWLNAVSVLATEEQLQEIRLLPFVKKVTPVLTFIRKKPAEPEPTPLSKSNSYSSKTDNIFDYGASFAQNDIISVPIIHNFGYSGKGILVTLIDSGFNYQVHDAFQRLLVLAEYDFINHDAITRDEDSQDSPGQDSHGTEVLSLIGAFLPGQIIGPAFNATYALAKTEYVPTETRIEEDNWVAGIEWADSLGTDVVSTSLGYRDFDDGFAYTYEDLNGKTMVTSIAATKAVEKGIVVVASAGNEGNSSSWPYVISPAEGIGVIAVGAVNSDGERASFSSIGPTYDGRTKPNVMAMGVGNAIVDPNNMTGLRFGSGTSFSAPMIAGVCALLLEINPRWTPADVRQALEISASQATAPDNFYGWGIANALKAAEFGGGSGTLPADFTFQATKTNPGQQYSRFVFDLPESGNLRVTFFNILGQKVAEESMWRFAGSGREFTWPWPAELASGIYFARFELNQQIGKQKVIINR